MGLAFGDTPITSLRLGDQVVTRAYLGDTLVWELPPVTMTVEGTTFSPRLELVGGSTATLTWTDETDTVVGTGIAPDITWGDVGPHEVRLQVSDPEDVVTLNLGFFNGQDNGLYSLPASYNYATQPVVAITNLQNLSGLRRFMAARTNGVSELEDLYTGPLLAGHLNFTGMNTLEYIECYAADVESISLAGCISLMRVCFERCQLTYIDLNPVRTTLLDLRAAVQKTGTLTLEPMTGPFEVLYHFCTRSQVLINYPDTELLPMIRQLWIWKNHLDIDTMTVRSGAPIHTIRISTDDSEPDVGQNQVRVLDLAGQTWGPLEGPMHLRAYNAGMEEINVTGMSPVGTIQLEDNALSQASVDHVLTTADSWGTSGGTLHIDGGANSPVSTAGEAAALSLISKGWDVQYKPAATVLWEDTFDRADAVGLAAVGNGWMTPDVDVDANIVSNRIVLTGPASYRRWLNPATGTLPNNLEVEIGFTIAAASEPGTWWGVASRWLPTGSTGNRVLFQGSKTILRIGQAHSSSDGTSVDISALTPPGWNDPGQHTLTFRSVGTTHTVWCDGVLVASRAYGTNGNVPNGYVGFCGQPQARAWDYIRVRSAS